MTHHFLKTAPNFFEHVWSGEKTFEVRLDDRGYQKGDTVELAEWDRTLGCTCVGKSDGIHDAATCAKYSGRSVTACIGHVLASTPSRGSVRGFNGNGHVVFSLCDTGRHLKEPAAVATVTDAPSPLQVARIMQSGGSR